MTELTLQNHRRTMWHFIPGLASWSAVITGVALWGGAILLLRRGVQRAPDPRYPAGYGYRNTVY